jgi:hypothetical protein
MLFWMKFGLLSLQLLSQFLDGIEGGLVRDSRQPPVALKGGIDLNTPVAHFQSRICAAAATYSL